MASAWPRESPLQPPPNRGLPRAAFTWPLHLPERNLSKPASGDGNGCEVLCPLLAAWPGTELAREPALVTPLLTFLQGRGAGSPGSSPSELQAHSDPGGIQHTRPKTISSQVAEKPVEDSLGSEPTRHPLMSFPSCVLDLGLAGALPSHPSAQVCSEIMMGMLG